MGSQNIALDFMVEHGGKLAKSLLYPIPQNVVTNIKGLKYVPKESLETDVVELTKEAAQEKFREVKKLNLFGDNFDKYEQYFITADGKYNKKALDILTELPDKDGWLAEGFIPSIMKSLNISKVDKTALMGLKDIYISLTEHHNIDFVKDGLNFFKYSLNKDGSFDKKALEEVRAIAEKYKDSKNSQQEIITALAFRDLRGVKSIDELSIPQKNELLNKLAAHRLLSRNQQVYKDIEVLPKTEEEFKALMSKLIKETSVDVKALPLAQRQNVIKTLENIASVDPKTATLQIESIYPEIGKLCEGTVELLQKIMKDERFSSLPAEDKLTAQLAVILKDSSSIHGIKDAEQSAFNAFYLAEKLGLPHDNKFKLYALIKNQNLYIDADTNNLTMAVIERAGCELRHENSYKMFEMINDAKGVETKTKETVSSKLNKVCTARMLLANGSYGITQTKLPKASQFIVNGDSVQKVKKDGVENIVVYFDGKKPIMYKDETGAIKELKPEDVYNYCHTTGNLKGVELASRPNSDYAMSSSFMNPKKGTHHMFSTEGVIVRVPKGNTYYEHKISDPDGTGFGKSGDSTIFKGYWRLRHDASDKCAELGWKQISELPENKAIELRQTLDSMLSNGRYGENISFNPEPIGAFFEGPYKGYSPMYTLFIDENKTMKKQMGLKDIAEKYICKILKKEYKPQLYKFEDVPLEHRTYARDKDFAVFHLGY